ncbi:MAG TPA: YtxH domain-containing protein [Longimicrobium sp.]|nr:YtxH domain-containing protein [Longimicrobium sp.]
MSGTGRDHAGMEAGTTRSMAMGDQPGTAEVHSGIAFAPESQQGTRERAAGKVRDVADTVTGAAGNLGGRARSVAENVGEKAGDLASQARSRVSGLADRATTALDDRGVLGKLRENPLPALGVAFAVGFLLAGGGRSSANPGSTAARARSELRNALMAGVTAGLGQGARSFLRNLGAEDSVVNDVMQNLPGLGGSAGGGSSRGGGSMGGTSRPASAGRAGTTSRMASTGTHRPPSHQENF